MTQSPSLPELPKLPQADGYAAISTDGTHSIVVPPQDFAKHNGYAIFTADQMNTHYLKGYEAGRASRAQSEWQTPPASWRLLAKAAIDLLWAIDTKHDTEKPPTKYAVPYGAVNNLRQALGCAEDPPLAPTQGAEEAAPQAVVGEVVPDELYLMLRDISNEYHCSVGGDEVGKWLEKSWSRLRSLGLRAIAPSDEGKLLRMVFDDMDTCCGELGADYEFKELSSETVEAFKAYRANGGE